MHKKNLKRRTFIKGSVATAVGLVTAGSVLTKKNDSYAQENITNTQNTSVEYESILKPPVLLHNYGETSIGVAFAVNVDSAKYYYANSRVKYWPKDNKAEICTVKCGGYRMTDMNDKMQRIRLNNLIPDTEYEFEVLLDKIYFKDGNNRRREGTETLGPYSFKTAGISANPHFCVINDTHHNTNQSFNKCMKAISDNNYDPTCILFNGDITEEENTIDKLIEGLCVPAGIETDHWNTKFPLLLCPGDQEQKGIASRNLDDVWMYRQPEERLSKYWDLGRNFAIRIGNIALVGLDTGIESQDTEISTSLYSNDAYIKAQTEWLEYVLNLERIKSARFLIAACHIPLYCPDNALSINQNGNTKGDSFQDSEEDYRIAWGELLTNAKCCLVISGHEHKYRFEAAEVVGRTWAQIVGGGNSDTIDEQHPLVLDFSINDDENLQINVFDVIKNEIIDSQLILG